MSAHAALHYLGRLRIYLRVARLDHWFKNVFLLAGSFMALLSQDAGVRSPRVFLGKTALALLLACFASSANYIINEILDAPFDRMHPVKRFRPIPSGIVTPRLLWLLAGIFAALALGGAWLLMSREFFFSLLALVIMGLVYNVRPLRTKEVAYLDVVSESVNNPIRLFMGWYALTSVYPPPATLVLSYWAFGAFLMTAKRYAEYRFIADPVRAAAYRSSFRHYTEESLLVAMICHIALTMFFFGALLMRYRKYELFLILPFLVIFIGWFFKLSFEKDSIVREPEKLWEKPTFAAYSLGVFGLFVALAFVKFPGLWEMLDRIRIGPPLP